jgi:EAL domain-containing protein (putative c-di-GMP-specific phosphodiesterase class I)
MFHRVIPLPARPLPEAVASDSPARAHPGVAADPVSPTDGEATAPARPGDLSRLVRESLAAHRVRIEFQPIRMIRDDSRIASHEGFMRLLDESGRPIPTGRSMGAVEESSLGRELDGVALRLGLQALRTDPALRLAVNASARSLGNAAWRATLEAAAGELGPRLTLEVGEGSATLLADRVARFVEELRPRGLRFVLDDFGGGSLSLRQLRDFRFDGLKINRSIVKGIEASPDNQALVGALVTVAHRFGMFAVAKGVDTQREAAHLRDLGVDGLQGYLLGRPGPRL